MVLGLGPEALGCTVANKVFIRALLLRQLNKVFFRALFRHPGGGPH